MPKDVQQILFIRLSAIGDIVMASGLPSSIKQSYSHNGKAVELTWLVEAPYEALVSNHPYVDHVITWPKSEWRALLKARKYWALFNAIKAFRKQLREKNFTVAIEGQGLLKSAFFAYLSGASQRIGFKSKENSQRLLTLALNKPASQQISSEYRHLAKTLHSLCSAEDHDSMSYEMCIRSSNVAMQSAISKTSHLGLTQPFIVIAPFTTRPQKHWPSKHWQTLIRKIRKHSNLPIAILGGPRDAAQAEALTFECNGVISLAGKISLEESVSVLSLCYAFVGVDTGLTHLATSYKKPTVAIFGSTRPYTVTDNAYTHVLFEDMACAPCKRKPTCDGHFDCMTLVTPEQVFNQLKAYISH